MNYVRKHFAEQRVAFVYEAGPTGYGLYEGLVAQEYRCVIASPSLIPKAPGQRGKTNRLDSRGLAESLRGGQLKSIPVPSTLYRELRPLTPLRDTFGSEVVALKLRITSLWLWEGLACPPAPAGRHWACGVNKTRRALPCAPTVRFKLDQLLDSLAFPEPQGRKTTKEIRRFCQREPELAQCLQYRMTIPGMGWSVASQVLARSGDGRPLNNVRQWAGFLGVVPTEHATGDPTERGALTPTGEGRLPSNLIQAAGSAIRQNAELREFFRSSCRTQPPHLASRVASVAVARQLSGRSAGVWRPQSPYEVRAKVHSAPLTPEETVPQGTTRRLREPGEKPS